MVLVIIVFPKSQQYLRSILIHQHSISVLHQQNCNNSCYDMLWAIRTSSTPCDVFPSVDQLARDPAPKSHLKNQFFDHSEH